MANGLRCDSLGCIFRARGQVVALVRDSRALIDDCAVATVVISREPIRRGNCANVPYVVDRFDLWRGGAHAIWLQESGVRVQSAADYRGVRPWAPGRPN